jgi:hypothetical protein
MLSSFCISASFYFSRKILFLLLAISEIKFIDFYYFYSHKEDFPKINIKNKELRPYLLLFLVLAGINFIGALSPEYSFDALCDMIFL